MKELLTIPEAANLTDKCSQTIVMAIKRGKLKCEKRGKKKFIYLKDLDSYITSRYASNERKINGEKIYDQSKGRISIKDAAPKMNMTEPGLRYRIRIGEIRSYRLGSAIFLMIKDVEKYQKELQDKKII
jgi:hypothetical protein